MVSTIGLIVDRKGVDARAGNLTQNVIVNSQPGDRTVRHASTSLRSYST